MGALSFDGTSRPCTTPRRKESATNSVGPYYYSMNSTLVLKPLYATFTFANFHSMSNRVSTLTSKDSGNTWTARTSRLWIEIL